MIGRWLALLGFHSGACVFLASLLLVDHASIALAWLPETHVLILSTVVAFALGPFLGLVVVFRGPRPSESKRDGPSRKRQARAARRIRNVAGLLILFPAALFFGMAVMNAQGAMADLALGTAAGAGALISLLAPWIALYGRWFNEA